METNSETHVSVIGVSLIRPILTLVETLESQPPVEPNEVKTGDRENGYSCAIAALAGFLLESALNRTRYVRGEDGERISPAEYFAKISPDPELAADVEEVFAVRDAIVHNHLWKARTFWDANGSLKFKEPPQLLKGYGDHRLRRVMNPTTRLSQRLELNLFPERIWRRDAYIILKTVGRALETLESMKREYFYISPIHFAFRGQDFCFHEILNALAIPSGQSIIALEGKEKEPSIK